MRTRFSSAGIELLRLRAKALRRGTSPLTQTKALDLVAQQEGWPNWALLHKNADAALLEEALQLSLERFRGGDRGVFVLKLTLTDPKLRAELERAGEASSALPPAPPRWIVRRLTELRAAEPDPFLDHRWTEPRGRFVDGRFLCIVSTNGVPDAEVEAEITGRLHQIGASFRQEATTMLARRLAGSGEGGSIRLFYCRPKAGGGDEILAYTFTSVDEARRAELPPGAPPIGIPTEQGWWTYQAPFGWQAPHDR